MSLRIPFLSGLTTSLFSKYQISQDWYPMGAIGALQERVLIDSQSGYLIPSILWPGTITANKPLD